MIPYWGATGAGPTNDTGTQVGGNIVEDGTKGAFEQPGGPGGSIFNLVTSRPIAVGDTYTLTFYGLDSQNAGRTTPLLASFFYQTPPAAGAAYPYAAVGALGAPMAITLTGTFAQYALTYTVTAADMAAGDDIGIALTNNAAASGDYNGLDNFVLTVTPVPEPSTYAMLAIGGLGGVMVFRRRRA